MFLLDTNILIWLTTGDNRLSRRVKARLEAKGGRVHGTSVLCIYELGVAVSERRVRLTRDFGDIRRELLSAGLVEHPVTGSIVVDALGLDNLPRDPIDRIVVATARSLAATLVTSDERILAWHGKLDRLDARK